MKQFYFQYNEPIKIIWRAGTEDDPYIPKSETQKIVNNKISLFEIPDKFNKVNIEGYTELIIEPNSPRKIPNSNEFVVNYNNGIVTFNPTEEGQTVFVEYYARGYIQYPAQRIYVHSPNPYAVENLQELIDYLYNSKIELENAYVEFIQSSKDKLEMFVDYCDDNAQKLEDKYVEYVQLTEDKYNEFVDLADVKIDEITSAIVSCYNTIEESIIQTEKAKLATDECIIVTDNAQNAIDEMLILKDDCIQIKVACEEATQNAISETQKMYADRLNTRKIYKNPVDHIAEINLVYPEPEIGWTVMTKDNGNVYRYDGTGWRYIENLTGATPLADETMNGLMSKEFFIKLRDTEEGAQVNYIGEDAKEVLPQYFKQKTLVFVLNEEKFNLGVHDVILQFPYDGFIDSVKIFAKQGGLDFTSFKIETLESKYYTEDIQPWNNIFGNQAVKFYYSENIAEIPDITYKTVYKDDYFRVNFLDVADGIKNITILININI